MTTNRADCPVLTPAKRNDAADWFHCRFCALMFATYDEYKSHTFRHFNTKSCPECHVPLIQICGDEWFCLHTTSNCHYSHDFDDRNSDGESDILQSLSIKREPSDEFDSNVFTEIHTDGFQNVHTDYYQLAPITQFNADVKHTESDSNSPQNAPFNDDEEHTESDSNSSQNSPFNDDEEHSESGSNYSDEDEFTPPKKQKASRQNVRRDFPCVQCGKEYSNRYNLLKHFKCHEADENVEVRKERLPGDDQEEEALDTKNESSIGPNDSGKGRPNEHVAQKRTKVAKSHRPKQKLSTDNKSGGEVWHMCAVCGEQFPDKSNMRAHEKTHSGMKTTCFVCEKKFSNKSALRRHMKGVHKKIRSFHCNIDGCEWKFSHTGALKLHQARKHGLVTKRNACPICSKEFPNSTYHLNRHLKAHANNTAKVYIPESKTPAAPAETSEVSE